jgi:transposase
MESCSGSHFLGRALRDQGHEVRLMPTQYSKPYVQTYRSDFLDAEAIAKAVEQPRMHFVPIKTEKQLDLQALHCVRERWKPLTCSAEQFVASIDSQAPSILAQR